MRSAVVALVLTVIAGVAALLAVAAHDKRGVVQTSGVLDIAPITDIYPGQEACQGPLRTVDQVHAAGFSIVAGPRTPKLLLRAIGSETHRVAARAEIAPGYRPGGMVIGTFDRPVPQDRSIDLCLANRGSGPNHVVIRGDNGSTDLCAIFPGSAACRWGFAHPTSTTSTASFEDRQVPGTMNVALYRRSPVSTLSQVPRMMSRASTFRPSFVSPALWWVLVALALVAAPAGLAWAVRQLPAEPAP